MYFCSLLQFLKTAFFIKFMLRKGLSVNIDGKEHIYYAHFFTGVVDIYALCYLLIFIDPEVHLSHLENKVVALGD